jgi:hypothetical protein
MQLHVVPAKAGTHAEVNEIALAAWRQTQHGVPLSREVISGSAGNDDFEGND